MRKNTFVLRVHTETKNIYKTHYIHILYIHA